MRCGRVLRHGRPHGHRHHPRRTVGGLAAWARAFAVAVRPVPVGRRAGRSRASSARSCSARLAGARSRSAPAPASTCRTTPMTSTNWSWPNRTPRCAPASTKRLRRSRPPGAAGRRAGGAAAVRRRIDRHGRLDLRVVHRRRSRSRPAGDRAGVAARRSAALHRARPFRLAEARPLAGPPGQAVAPLRTRLSLQPRDRGADRGLRVRARRRARRVMARDAADRATTHHRPSTQDRAMAETAHSSPTQPVGEPRGGRSMADVRVGLFPAALAAQRRSGAAACDPRVAVAEAGVDHLCVGDHVSFFVGAGSDGLITASLAARCAGRAAGVRRALPAAVASSGSRRPPARHDRAARTRPAHARRRDRRRGPPRDRDLRRRPEDAWTPDGRVPADPARPRRRHAGHLRRRVLLASTTP